MEPEVFVVDNHRCYIIRGKEASNLWHLRLLGLKSSDAIQSYIKEPQYMATNLRFF